MERIIASLHSMLTKRHLLLIFIVFPNMNVIAQSIDVVYQYCKNFASWTSERNIIYVHAMENLHGISPAFRIGNKLTEQLATKNNVPKTDAYEWDVFLPWMQKEADRGIQFNFSDVKSVPEEYVDQEYPGVQYVSCNISIKGSISYDNKDLFILKKGKIVKIVDYVESTDIVTGKKKIEVDYLDLALCAFADKDYLKCYKLYKERVLKGIYQKAKDHYVSASDIFPYVESCIALGKWEEAMHGISDHHIVTNRKTWVNGIEWKLDPEDLKTWNSMKDPLMNYLLKKTYKNYIFNAGAIKESPIINHVSKCHNIPIDDIIEDAATFFWSERSNWMNAVPLRAAAELGHSEAQKQLGKYYLTGCNNDPVSRNSNTIACDTIKAMRWFELAAFQGDVESANIAAYFYLSGQGIRKDYAKAFSLYENNAHKNDFDSQYGLGLCYYWGYGVQQNFDYALQYLKATEDWHSEVSYLIGNIYYMDNYRPEAIKYFNKALKRNDLNKRVRYSILMTLSDCNRFGRCGLPINIMEAERLLAEAEKLDINETTDIKDCLIKLTYISLDHENS